MIDGLGPFVEDLMRGQWRRALTDNRVFRSWFRTGYPSTPRQQALIMFNNVFLHLHPVRIRRESLRITYTFCLGGLSFFLFLRHHMEYPNANCRRRSSTGTCFSETNRLVFAS
jgi:hypothetical protein